MDITVGERRAVVEDEGGGALARFLDAGVKVFFFPCGKLLRFAGGEPGLHREIGLREVECFFVI